MPRRWKQWRGGGFPSMPILRAIHTNTETGKTVNLNELDDTIRKFAGALFQNERDHYMKELIEYGICLKPIQEQIETRLDNGIRVLGIAQSTQNDPREDVWLQLLCDYELVSDALLNIQGWLSNNPEVSMYPRRAE